MAEIMEAIKPTLVAHFKPALLARMTMVPFLPISMDALGEITRLKLNGMVSRLKTNQRIETTYSDDLVNTIAARCTEVDTGARNIDHILRSTLMPMLSMAILEKMADEKPPRKLHIDVDDKKNFTAAFSAPTSNWTCWMAGSPSSDTSRSAVSSIAVPAVYAG